MEEMDKVKWRPADIPVPNLLHRHACHYEGLANRIFAAGFAFDPITQGV
jgi:hypothetical protein